MSSCTISDKLRATYISSMTSEYEMSQILLTSCQHHSLRTMIHIRSNSIGSVCNLSCMFTVMQLVTVRMIIMIDMGWAGDISPRCNIDKLLIKRIKKSVEILALTSKDKQMGTLHYLINRRQDIVHYPMTSVILARNTSICSLVVPGPWRLPRWELCKFSMGVSSRYNDGILL